MTVQIELRGIADTEIHVRIIECPIYCAVERRAVVERHAVRTERIACGIQPVGRRGIGLDSGNRERNIGYDNDSTAVTVGNQAPTGMGETCGEHDPSVEFRTGNTIRTVGKSERRIEHIGRSGSEDKAAETHSLFFPADDRTVVFSAVERYRHRFLRRGR